MDRKTFLKLVSAAAGTLPIASNAGLSLISTLGIPSSMSRSVERQLRTEPLARTEVRSERGGPRLFLNGEEIPPLMALSTTLTTTIDNYKKAGIRIIQPILGMQAGWTGPDTYDFSLYDALMIELLNRFPDAYLLPRLQLNTPRWWKEAHPDECLVYGLPINQNSYDVIRKQDLKPAEGGHPFFSGRELWEVSFASEPWRADTADMLRAFVRHTETAPYAPRMFGYFPATGASGEWNCYGSDFLHDYSRPMMARAGSIPTPRERLETSFGLLRDPAKERHVSDYYRTFHSVMAEACVDSVRAIKDESNGRLVCGVFFAYLMETVRIQEDGYLMPQSVLDAPEVDFIANPYAYQNTNLDGNDRWKSEMEDGGGNLLGQARGVGGDGAFRALTESLRRRGKLYISEIDPATYLDAENRWRDIGGTGSDTVEGTRKILERDLGKVFATGVGGWMYDFGPLYGVPSGWYGGDDTIETMKRFSELMKLRPELDISPVAEIAVCPDTASFFYTRNWMEERPWNGYGIRYSDLFNQWFLNSQNRAWHRMGTPVDFLHREDLTRDDFRRYKLLFLPNAFYLEKGDAEKMRDQLRDSGSTVVWYYAPGYIGEDRLDLSTMEYLTGMSFDILEASGPLLMQRGADLPADLPERFGIKSTANYRPRFAVTDDNCEVLGTWVGSYAQTAFARKQQDGWTSVFVGTAPLPPDILRWLAADAGARIWSDQSDVVFATEDAAMLVAVGDGERTFSWHKSLFDPARKTTNRENTLRLEHGDVVLSYHRS